jgi:HD-GYP domain-containing protein (c-di-GMP phosphodiesterase class II)
MKQKISLSELRLGMFIIDVDAAWFDHPIWQPQSLLQDPEVIRVLQAARISDVWIDPARGLKPEPKAAPVPTRRPPRSQAPAKEAAPASVRTARQPGDEKPEPPRPARPALEPAPPEVKAEPPRDMRGGLPVEEDNPASVPARAWNPPEEALRPVRAVGDFAAELARARRLCADAGQEVASMFRSVRMGRALGEKDVMPLVSQIALAVQEIPGALLSVARLKTHDNYTYMHSVAVCALMTALARQLGLDEADAHDAGVGGLMHDLGKALVDPNILAKPGALDALEFAAVKKHPGFGYGLLADQTEFADSAKDIVLHHHEKVDGSGYPDGLSGNQISLLARMGAVCDVYDAITSNRPYKEGWDPAIAIRRMAQWHGHFDEDILKQFIATIGIFPVGSLVALTSGRLAVVLQPGTSTLSRPVVRAFFSIRTNEPIPIETIDLGLPGCSDRIIRPEDPAHWGFKHLERVLQA